VVVRAGGAVCGTVVDDRGRPLPSANVELRPAVTEGGATMALFQPLLTFGLDAGSAVTRPDGTFAFAHVAPATYLLRIRHGDFAPRTRRGLVVAEGESLDLGSLPLARGTRLSGSVTLDGASCRAATAAKPAATPAVAGSSRSASRPAATWCSPAASCPTIRSRSPRTRR
jgi:hypothetical protein